MKYVLTMMNTGFTKNNADSIINLIILYTEYFWTLQIDPHTQVDAITHICSIVNSGSTCRLILTIFLNDNFQKTAATIS